MLNFRIGRWLAIAMIGALALAGCGGDDDAPTDPGGGSTGLDTFTEEAAVTQAQTAAPQAVALVSQITSLAVGIGGKTSTYAWNESTQRWEWHYISDEEGYLYDLIYTVQYLNGNTPQQEALGASSVHHTMIGTGAWDFSSDGYNFVYDFSYVYDTTITGLGTGAYVMMGSGTYDIAYQYTGDGGNQSANYTSSWEILGNGITVTAGGCPNGTVRYQFGSFHTDVVFNGTNTATYTTYNGSGGVVAAGGGTEWIGCEN